MNDENEEAEQWSLYLVRTAQGSLYTGVTTDVLRRFQEHENKDKKNKGAKALRGKGPLTLVFEIVVGNRSDALKLEYRIKQMSRTDKELLINRSADPEELKTWLQKK
jgi:putative endonuclease